MGKNQNVKVEEEVEIKELRTPDGNIVQVTEKVGFFKKMKNNLAAFNKNHPKLAKTGKVIGTAALATATGLIGYAVGVKKTTSNDVESDIEILDMDSVGNEDDIYSAVETDDAQ